MIKQVLLMLSLFTLGLVSATADDAEPYIAGTHYDVINPPIRVVEPGKIELAEFFWYGCGHCYTFEAVIGQWKKTMPDDVSFRGIPAVWRGVMELHAKAYYTAQALGVLDTMSPVIFRAMNEERKPLGSDAEIEALFVANGVSSEDFNKAYNSFGVNSQVSQGVAAAKGARVTGTPSLMVNGKYLISAGKAGDQASMLKVAEYLIEQERASAN